MNDQWLRSFGGRAKRVLADAGPVILFFLCAFYSILWLFGVQYIIVVSVLATLFKVRRQKKQTPFKLLSMAAVQLLLAVLAFFAGHSLVLCVILNILVPFLLVFLQSNQFNQKGYFTSAMGFVFFQLRPVPSEQFGQFLCAMVYGLILLIAALLISSHGREKEEDYGKEKQGLKVLASQLDSWASGEDCGENRELFAIQRSLYKQVEQSRGISYALNREGEIHFMAALLFQRSIFFFSVLKEIKIAEEGRQFLLRLCAFLREFGRLWPENGKARRHKGNERERTDACQIPDIPECIGEPSALLEGQELQGEGSASARAGEKQGESVSTARTSKQQCESVSPARPNEKPGDIAYSRLRLWGEQLIREAGGRRDEIGRFGEQTVSQLLMISERLERESAARGQGESASGRTKGRRKPLAWIRQRFRPDTFEMRFSLRLSAVLTLGFLFSRLSGFNHAYWFVLNAFLLLQPMYEDSAFRLKNRFVGTVAGCTLLYFALPLFPGVQGHFILATILTAFMYCAQPGTWKQAIFSTSFAITLASLAMQETIAMELRLIYVGLATVFVLVINRFFFPTSMRGQFQDNIWGLFHMQHSYLRILIASLRVPLDYGAVRDGLIRFQLMHEQIDDYLQKRMSAEEQAYYRKLLALFWKMSSEMEQILFLTEDRKRELKDLDALEHFCQVCSYVIQEAGNMVCLKAKKEQMIARNAPVNTQVEGAPYLSVLLQKYSRDVSALYRLALVHKIEKKVKKEDHT